MGFEQMSITDYLFPTVSIDKPIRLIELFSGLGATAMALRNLGIPFEHYLTCEWEIHSIAAYHEIHMGDDKTDYSADMDDESLIKWLAEKGISVDGKKPLTERQIRSHADGERWRREIYNDIRATHNLVNISKTRGASVQKDSMILEVVDESHIAESEKRIWKEDQKSI